MGMTMVWDDLPISIQNEYRGKAKLYYESGYIDYEEIDDMAKKLWIKDEDTKRRSD